ncbi:MAG: hypothetical protein FWH22_03500 [Fibromonadales bacterium]|nr:hypothetical protein [Fibromonadales bacterium]
MRIFIDANIIIDVLLKRVDFIGESAKVLAICKSKKSALAAAALTVAGVK